MTTEPQTTPENDHSGVPKYLPVRLPDDARQQIERALLGRTGINGTAAVMSLLMSWPCIAPNDPQASGFVIPSDTFDRVCDVLQYVSRGRSFATTDAYPDATARRALAELDDSRSIEAHASEAITTKLADLIEQAHANRRTAWNENLGPEIARHWGALAGFLRRHLPAGHPLAYPAVKTAEEDDEQQPKSCPECSAQPWRPHRDDCPTLIDHGFHTEPR